MKRRTKHSLAITILFLGFFGLEAGTFLSNAHAFSSQKIVTLSAGVFVGTPSQQGPLGGFIQIHHVPLTGISPITKECIIQGEAGEVIKNLAPSFPSRITPLQAGSKGQPLALSGNIRIRVFYRFVIPGGPPDAIGETPTELPPVYGPDPTAFAFEVPPGSFQNGALQYRILAERLKDNNGVTVVVASVTYPATTATTPDPWVSVGIVANASRVFDGAGGAFILPDGNPNDGQTEIDVPAGVISEPTTISVDQIDPNSPGIPPLTGFPAPVAMYHLDSDHPIKSVMQVTLLYQDFVFPAGEQGVFNGTSLSENLGSIVWYDGFSWRRLGGLINTSANTITTRVENLNYMAIVPAGAVSAEQRRPMEKIITPNGDGHNDTILFALDSGSVEIFDITGRRVRTLVSASNPVWDGRDDNGKIVESGVYIYQYEADGKRISGLVAVAK